MIRPCSADARTRAPSRERPSTDEIASASSAARGKAATARLHCHTDADVEALRHGALRLRRSEAVLPRALLRPRDGEAGPGLSKGDRTELHRDELLSSLYALGEALASEYAGLDSGDGSASTAVANGQAPDGLETLLRLMSPARKVNPKLEIRRAAGSPDRVGECVQVALCARTPAERQRALGRVRDLEALAELHKAVGGDITLELHAPGVNKALPCRYAQRYFEDLLFSMDYEPGSALDARRHRTVILSDADGTLYDKQESCPEDPLGANLGNSPVREPLLAYLRAGGVLGVCTGNDLERTRLRMLAGIPEEERPTLLRRVFISANGGASLAVFGRDGRLRGLPGYGSVDPTTRREPALDVVNEPPQRPLDAVYLGDDARPHGNDFQGFEVLGPARSICVSSQSTAEIEPALRSNHLPGEVRGTERFLREVVTRLQGSVALTEPLFDERAVGRMVEQVRARVD